MKRKSQARSPSPPSRAHLSVSHGERVRRVVRSARRVMVLVSGSGKDDRDERVLAKVRLYVSAGATSVMSGRNMWLRRLGEALELTRRVQRILARAPQA